MRIFYKSQSENIFSIVSRFRISLKEDSFNKISADLVIKSLGFDPENLPKLFNAEELAISKWGLSLIHI